MIAGGPSAYWTVYSKTIYFGDRGVQRGTAVEYARLFEEELSKKLAAEKNSSTST
jgi:hypothetical protein